MSAPKCPFNGGDQRMQVDPDQPCPVCGDYGDHRAWNSNNCVDGDEPVTSHAAAAAEIARLRAEVAALREAQAWQPIETAPRDGTSVLLAIDDRGDCGISEAQTGYWRPEYCCWLMEGGDQEESEKYGPHWWMPLPKPPQVTP